MRVTGAHALSGLGFEPGPMLIVSPALNMVLPGLGTAIGIVVNLLMGGGSQHELELSKHVYENVLKPLVAETKALNYDAAPRFFSDPGFEVHYHKAIAIAPAAAQAFYALALGYALKYNNPVYLNQIAVMVADDRRWLGYSPSYNEAQREQEEIYNRENETPEYWALRAAQQQQRSDAGD